MSKRDEASEVVQQLGWPAPSALWVPDEDATADMIGEPPMVARPETMHVATKDYTLSVLFKVRASWWRRLGRWLLRMVRKVTP